MYLVIKKRYMQTIGVDEVVQNQEASEDSYGVQMVVFYREKREKFS